MVIGVPSCDEQDIFFTKNWSRLFKSIWSPCFIFRWHLPCFLADELSWTTGKLGPWLLGNCKATNSNLCCYVRCWNDNFVITVYPRGVTVTVTDWICISLSLLNLCWCTRWLVVHNIHTNQGSQYTSVSTYTLVVHNVALYWLVGAHDESCTLWTTTYIDCAQCDVVSLAVCVQKSCMF